MTFDILTSGRLGEEFQDYANDFEGISCTYISDQKLAAKRIKEFDALAGFYAYGDKDITHIKWIHSFGAGVEGIVNHPNLNKHIIISRTVGNMGRRIGEYCLAYTLYILRDIEKILNDQKLKVWDRPENKMLIDKEILIFGTGGIGSGIAEVFHHLTKSVTGINSSGRYVEHFDKIIKIEDLTSLDLKKYDIVINALPLTDQTINFFNLDLFKNFKDVIFLNIGRGASINEQDLLKALEEKYVNKAVLDVFKDEPLSASSPFWDHQNVIVTPHYSGVTDMADVKQSFEKVYKALIRGERNELFVDIEKSY